MASHPDFICIGAQKAATTWLYQSLKARPDIFLPVIKELHYFSQLHAQQYINYAPGHRKDQTTEALHHYNKPSSYVIRALKKLRPAQPPPTSPPPVLSDASGISQTHSPHVYGPPHRKSQISDCLQYFQRLVKALPPVQRESKLKQLEHIDTDTIDDDWYTGIFDFATPGQVRGEICPCYMPLPEDGIKHILQINKKIRVFLIVRDPIDRIWSHLRMHISFNDPEFNTNRIFDGSFSLAPYLMFTDYEMAITRWESVLPKKAFRVILYDDIVNQPTNVLADVLQFIGADPDTNGSEPNAPVFVGEQIELPCKLREYLLETLQPQYRFLSKRFPQYVKSWTTQHQNAIYANA